MEELIVVTYPKTLSIEARPIEHEAVPEGSVGLGYFFEGHLIARGVVTPDAVRAISTLLRSPVSVALAATEDEAGNIDGRFCLVLPLDHGQLAEDDEADEPWKASVPAPPTDFGGGSYEESAREEDEDGDASERPQLALLPLGNVIRNARDRRHPDAVEDDARDMLHNLVGGQAKDAVAKAIDDLLNSL